MTRTLPCRKPSVSAPVVTTPAFALVVVALSTGAAGAAGGEGSVASAVVPVCTLVNGWD